ncbi:FAD synthetase family protein [Thalassobacillus sp. CUG 92003]|uniref:FAD synthetase family protein n=1 Tax=Thalassobacillus sp. CUG 92003 TaxID=2736641 RepID=UPI0015E6F7D6|nr:FAD synthetase family protein [Thalassobacillus sp. CUG 92003]
MKHIYVDFPIQEEVKASSEPCVMAMGFFDGVHLGHQEIVKTAKKKADEKNVKLAVMTFFPHPSSVIPKGEKVTRYLTPLSVKADRFASLGVDIMYIVEFNERVAKIPHDQFVEDYLCGLQCRHAVAGFDYKYGFKGKGDMGQLSTDSKGRFDVTTVSKFTQQGRKVGSTLLRELLATGRVEKVKDYLGKDYEIEGTLSGKGREVDMTLDDTYFLPCRGTYEVTLSDGTFQSKGSCEIHTAEHQSHLTIKLFNDSYVGTVHSGSLTWNDFMADFHMQAFHAQRDMMESEATL